MSFSLKHLAQATQYLALALLIYFSAGFIWQLLIPQHRGAPLRLAQAAPTTQAFNPDAVLRLFQASNSVANEASNLSLKALISGREGIAIIEGLEASAVAVKVGTDLGQHGKLIAANTDHIVLEHQGTQRKVYLPASAVATNTANTAPAAAPSSPASNPEKQAISLTRGQLTGILQGGNLANWSKGLNTSATGGIVVEQASQQQLAQILQLRDGDILQAINGRPLNKLDDLSLLYGAFSQQTNLALQIQRQNQSQTISYTVNP
jgi:general secretion pathway protein C